MEPYSFNIGIQIKVLYSILHQRYTVYSSSGKMKLQCAKITVHMLQVAASVAFPQAQQTLNSGSDDDSTLIQHNVPVRLQRYTQGSVSSQLPNTVNQLLFASEKISRGSREPHCHEYFSSRTRCIM
jgi:hypothetical protein